MSSAFRRHIPRMRRNVAALPPAAVTAIVALLLSLCLVRTAECHLRPLLAPLARVQIENKVTLLLEEAFDTAMAENAASYGDLVTIERDGDGRICLITTDTAAMNRLRLDLTSRMLDSLSRETVTTVRIPLGSLLSSELVWGRGPSVCIQAISVGTVHGEFESNFSDAGVNQTLHRIELILSVPITVLLPGGPLEIPVTTGLCVAETVIVGQIPETYLQSGLGSSG